MNAIELPAHTPENEVSGLIVDACVRIHRKLGPGLLESVYLRILAHELRKLGLDVRTQHGFPVRWDGLVFENGFRSDLLVHQKVIVEVKAVERPARVHKRQLLTYLVMTGLRVGLLANFGQERMCDGLTRVVNGARSLPCPRPSLG